MPISSDIKIDYTNMRIYQDHPYVASTDTAYPTQTLYTYLMDEFDNQAQMDNTIPITAQTPNAYTMVNGWFIDDETVKWLKNGAIATDGWTHPTNINGIRLLTLNNLAGVTSADIGALVQGQTTSDSGKLLAFNTTRKTLWVRCTGSSDLFDNGTEEIYVAAASAGSLTASGSTGENLYVNVYTLGTLTSSLDTIYVIQNEEKVPAWWATGIDAFDVLVKVQEMGAAIASGDVTVFCRYYPTDGDAALYDHFPIKLTAGRQAVPLATALDLNNTSSQSLVAGYLNGTTYTITFGFAGPYDKTLGGQTASYDVSIGCNGAKVSELYEACKYVCRESSTVQLASDNGEEYIAAQPAYSPVKASPFGTFAGGKFFGARGVWIENYDADDAQAFQLISANNTTINPPNTVVCKVVNVASGDSVAMFMLQGGAIDKDTYTLAGAHASTASVVTVSGAIAGSWSGQDPPQAGYLRIVSSAAQETEILTQYGSWASSQFILTASLITACDAGWNVYVPIIDASASSDAIQNSLVKELTSTVNIMTVVRKYGGAGDSIIPWSQTTVIGNTGVIVNATRTQDGIVS